jgi:hypothetical protein
VRPGFGEAEWHLAAASFEQVLAGAGHDRVDHQVELVEQALGKQEPDADAHAPRRG